MKKTYITPALVAVKIEATQLLVNSIDKSGQITEEEEILSSKYQGGLIWEDDEEK